MEEGTYYTYAGLPPSQDLDDGRTGSLLSDILSYPYYPQVDAEARSHILCDTLPIVDLHRYSGQYHSFISFVTV